MKINKLVLSILLILIIMYVINKKKKQNLEESMPNIKAYKIASELGCNYIDNYINTLKNKPKKGAVMFDIDDTLLYVKGDTLIPIKPIIDLLNYCITQDLLIIIITAREQKYRQYTIDDLNNNGINYSFLYLRKSPEDDNEMFKSKIKEELFYNYGIKILLSVGDNIIDVIGPKSGYCLKLPNKTDKKLYEKSPDSSNFIEVKLH